jgi:alkylhydroperoxidase family enzyme
MTDDVQVANRRLDASANEALIGMARMGAHAFGYTARPANRPPPRPALAPASVAAQQLHLLPEPALPGGARGGYPPSQARHPDRVVGDRTSLRGRAAALRYAEALTRAADTDRDAAFQHFHDALAEHFSSDEMLEIVAVVVNMNVWTRIKLAEGAMPRRAD